MKHILVLVKFFFTTILYISISSCLIPTTHAAQVNFDVRPSSFEIVSQPGKSIPISIDLINKSDHAFFGVKISSFDKDNGLLPYSIINSPIKLSLDTNDDDSQFVQKFEKKSINFKLFVDPLSPRKDYYFIIEIYQVNKSSITNQRNILVDATIQIPILLTVSEDGLSQEIIFVHGCHLEVGNFIEKFFYQYLGIVDSNTNPIFECLVENKGLNRVYLDTTIEYSNKLGQKGKIIIPKSHLLSKNIYKLSKSAFVSVNDTSAIPLYLNHWLLGKYQVSTILQNPISDKRWNVEVNFLALPYKLGAFLIFFIFLAIKYMNRQRK